MPKNPSIGPWPIAALAIRTALLIGIAMMLILLPAVVGAGSAVIPGA